MKSTSLKWWGEILKIALIKKISQLTDNQLINF